MIGRINDSPLSCIYGVMKKYFSKKIIAFLIATTMIAGGIATTATIPAYADMCGGLEMEDVYTPDPSDVIQDPILHWAVRSSLNEIKNRDLILTPELVGSKAVDSIIYENGSHPEDFETWGGRQHLVKSLEGLQYATAATHIDISYSDGVKGNEIEDLTPISGLTKLTKLKLYMDGITDISALSELINMRELSVRSNSISDISAVRKMSKLTNLDFGYNNVSDVSAVSNLTTLKYLDMSNNKIAELPDMSALTALESLNISNNQLNNESLEVIAQLTTLQTLDLSGNTEITDLKPLVELTNLKEDKTYLPVSSETKSDLFAAIKVNSEFKEFNISRMASDDLDYVKIALDDYDALTDSQREYLDLGMAEAARSNYAKVSAGEDPEYYEEYDKGGVQKPVWNRVDVSVVDSAGHPLSGITVKRAGLGTTEYTTDDSGKVSMPHASWDSDIEFTVTVSAEGYVCKPESMTYEVKDHKTYVVNGKRATGYEKLQFVLTPEAAYLDISSLEDAVEKCGTADDEYKYTEESYKNYSDALENAKVLLEGSASSEAGTTQDDVDAAAKTLSDAYEALTYKHVLTALKVNVRDENGNLFVRAFKLQVIPDGSTSKAWNIWADADNEISDGIAVQEILPTWKAGTSIEIKACNSEAYEFDKKIVATIEKTDDGTVYFDKINGEAVDYSFEVDVKAIPREGGAKDKDTEIAPDGSRLHAYIEKAESYKESSYTPNSYENLNNAVQSARNIVETASTQEQYNQAGADITSAIKNLVPVPDTLALERLINRYYSRDSYTSDSWNNYQNSLNAAKEVFDDANADQSSVDKAAENLKTAQNSLVIRGDKTNLRNKLEEAKAVDESKCEIGYKNLAKAIAAAEIVVENIDATTGDVNDAASALEDAMSGIVYYPEEEDIDCMPARFRAKVVDTNGDAVAGVPFKVVSGGKNISVSPIGVTDSDNTGNKQVSNSRGIIDFYIDDCAKDALTVVSIDGDKYNCTDEHSFIVTSPFMWMTSISTLDGKDFENGIHLTYTVTTETKSIKNKDLSIVIGSNDGGVSTEEFEATGNPVEPAVTIKDGDTTLKLDEDYSLEFSNNTELGIAEVTIKGIGNYRDSVTRHFRIIEPDEPSVIGESKRIYGAERVATSLAVADELKTIVGSEKFENIVIASGGSYPDALAGSYLARVKNAPVILVNSNNEAKVADYVKANLADGGKVYILGGESAVSKKFETSIAPNETVRLGGANRYETNILILEEAGVTSENLLVCTGTGYADCLSASAVDKPILIVGKELTKAQREYLSGLSADKIYAIGGENTVSSSIMRTVGQALGTNPETVRLAGSTRFETSVMVAEEFFGDNIDSVVISYGRNFPDGLSGGPLATALNGPLLLVTNDNCSMAKEFCSIHKVKQVIALGGPSLISDSVFESMTE